MRKRHKKKKRIPRDFFLTTEAWDRFIVMMMPGTHMFVRNGELYVRPFGFRGLADMRDV